MGIWGSYIFKLGRFEHTHAGTEVKAVGSYSLTSKGESRKN